jgi:hypothetical protein
MEPALLLALASALAASSTALLIALHLTLDLSPYGACLLAGYAASALVHASYLAIFPRAPRLPDARTRAAYFAAVRCSLYAAAFLGPFSFRNDFHVPYGLSPDGVPIALVAVQLMACIAVYACAAYTLRPDDVLVCAWAHDARCARCGLAAGRVPQPRPLAFALQLALVVAASSHTPLAYAFGLLIHDNPVGADDILVWRFVPAVSVLTTLAYLLAFCLAFRVSFLQRRRVGMQPWPATPYLPGLRTRTLFVRGMAALCAAHAALLPALVQARVGRVVLALWAADIVAVGAMAVCARILAAAENREQCAAEGHRWRCARVFCPVYGVGRKVGSAPPDLQVGPAQLWGNVWVS